MGGAERYHPFFFIYKAVIANIDKKPKPEGYSNYSLMSLN
jgi:hypothetical protein